MNILTADTLLHCQNSLGESPVWCTEQQALFWIDIRQSSLHRLKDKIHSSYSLTDSVTAFAAATNGQFIAATNTGFNSLALTDEIAVQQSIQPFLENSNDFRMNDAALDRQGRFWSGSIQAPPGNDDATGTLYRLQHNQHCAVLEGFCSQNGLAWSPDGRIMYVSDSHPSTASIWRYDFNIETGTPTNKTLFADQSLLKGRPDGATVDTDGCYWIAASDVGQILRLTPAGEIDAIVNVPTKHVTNICFGGPQLKTMFITTQRYLNPNEQAGNLFVLETDYQGIAETAYRGR
ncbi:MAG: SMP-30/gluconolactonase/LRE family protein [Oceanospirillaceae bacterium]|nr:SMP-30/gluconolactonase/LRE family protein [Oceanospirillaceae bacterium]